MDSLCRLYAVVVENVKKARDQQPQKEEAPSKLKVNDLVMVKDPDAAVFQPRYQPNYRVTAIFGNNRIEVQDEKRHKSMRRSAHVKFIEPKEKLVTQLPSAETLKQYGRGAKLLITHKDIPDLRFQGENEGETLEVNAVNVQELTLKEGSDEHSTPSSVPSNTDTGELIPDTEGDEYSTPSGTKISSDIMTGQEIDVMEVVRATSSGSDEHSTPSTEQRGERKDRLTDKGMVIEQAVTKEQGITDSQINVSKLGWFGTQVTHFVETITHMGCKVGLGGKANITTKCKNNPQNQSEFSFFL